jgi:hypothetical protein
MIYCYLKGGLCNILFQMAATYAFAKENNTEPSFPNLLEQLKYLNDDNHYNPKLNYSNDYLNIFQNCKTNAPQDGALRFEYPFHYDSFIPSDGSIVNGFFQSEKYFCKYRNEILKYFEPTNDIKIQVETTLKSLPRQFNVMHIRLGDYMRNPASHNNLPISYFLNGIKLLDSNLPYIIFSDDIEICKKNFKGDQYIFMENNKDYIDLLLMKEGQNYIISNSSFSWWGAWLNSNAKRVIAPSQWFGPVLSYHNTNDIIPTTWEKIAV